uniref:Uncharacterized protein n=1 Tax=Arundo donax TaxID=35708 RepID=A0A0A9ELT0_ARUDO
MFLLLSIDHSLFFKLMPQCKMLTYCFLIANAKCILLGVGTISILCKTCEYLCTHGAIVEFCR